MAGASLTIADWRAAAPRLAYELADDDPKPLAGEREFAAAPIVRSRELGGSRHDALRRLDRLRAELGLDRERARGWTIAETMAWSREGEGGAVAGHVEVARWLLEAAA